MQEFHQYDQGGCLINSSGELVTFTGIVITAPYIPSAFNASLMCLLKKCFLINNTYLEKDVFLYF